MKEQNNRYIDIHAHIIPAIDDGAGDWEEAFEMLKIAAVEHVAAMIATPHFVPLLHETDSGRIRREVQELNILSSRLEKGPVVYPGNELYLIRGAFESIRSGRCLTLAGSRYVLCELSMSEYPSADSIQEAEFLLKAGYIPVIAHPERYVWLEDNMELLQMLLNRGCKAQANSDAFSGKYGRKVQKRAELLIKAGLVQYIGSDCHDRKIRAPLLGSLTNRLTKIFGTEKTNGLLVGNAKQIIEREA